MSAAQEMTLGELAAFSDQKASALARLDFTEPLQRTKFLIQSDVKANFQGQHTPDQQPWPPRKAPRADGTTHLLWHTGRLIGSTAAGAPGHVEEITKTTLTFGTNLVYAARHQYGGTWNVPARSRAKPWVFTDPSGRKIFTRRLKAHAITTPARPFLGIGTALLGKISAVFETFLGSKL